MKNIGGKAFVPSHCSLFKECDSDQDIYCGGPPIQQEESYLKHESDVFETSKQDDQEDSSFCVRRKAIVQRKLFTPLLCILQSNVQTLALPERLDDLFLPIHQVLPACDVYEVLRKFGPEVCSGNVFFLYSSK